MFKKILPALVLSVMAASAHATVIDYSMMVSHTAEASGQFTGVDHNADGFLSLDELSALTFNIPFANYYFDLGVVTSFGRYDIVQNLWLNDGLNRNGSNFAYVTFFDGALEANPANITDLVTRVAQAPADVPEPASMMLSALGLLALGAARRRKK